MLGSIPDAGPGARGHRRCGCRQGGRWTERYSCVMATATGTWRIGSPAGAMWISRPGECRRPSRPVVCYGSGDTVWPRVYFGPQTRCQNPVDRPGLWVRSADAGRRVPLSRRPGDGADPPRGGGPPGAGL